MVHKLQTINVFQISPNLTVIVVIDIVHLVVSRYSGDGADDSVDERRGETDVIVIVVT